MTLSFLLVNYNMAGIVMRCVENICKVCPAGVAAEILIADNSSDTQLQFPEEFLRCHPIRILKCDNRGWIDALNRLLPLATGQCFVIMHADVELEDDCLGRLIAFLDSHPEAGIVSPNLYYPDGSPNRIRTHFPTLKSESAKLLNVVAGVFLRRAVVPEQPCWDRSADVQVDMVMSVCMVIRRELIEKIVCIDPALRVYYGNDFLSARAAGLGYRCYYVREARAIHFERFTPRDLYSKSREMDYKASPIPALAVMQTDYLVFLRSLYSNGTVAVFRLLLILQDSIQLAAQLKAFRSRKENIQHLWAAIRILCRPSPAFRA